MKNGKRILSLIMTLILVCSIIPVGNIKASAVTITNRDDGVWLFPVDSGYYSYFSDWAGCPGTGNCPFCGISHNNLNFGDEWHTWQKDYGGHNGIDLGVPSGANVYAMASGVVIAATYLDSRGNIVVIKHDLGNGWAYYSYYQHLSSYSVSSGQTVAVGNVIGYVGNTGVGSGAHLHFGIVMAPSSYNYSAVLSVDFVSAASANNWLRNNGYATGKIITNPKNANTNLSSVNYHPGSVTYTFDKSKVTIGSTVATTGISLGVEGVSLNVGESKNLTATVAPSNATNKTVTWSSNLPEIATVSNGRITGVSAGACTITAKASGGQTASCVVVVTNETPSAVAFSEYDGHYYELYDEVTSWSDAVAACEKLGGHTVTISSEEENEAVLSLINKGGKSRYHLGITDRETEGIWKDITGEACSYFNWADGEPPKTGTANTAENFAFIDATTGKWGDIRDYQANPNITGFICEYDYSPIKADAVTIIDGKVYELYDRYYPVELAEQLANIKGGYLFAPSTAKKQTAVSNWLRTKTSKTVFLIGAYADNDRNWHWSNGDNWSHENWNAGEPNNCNGIEDRALMSIGNNNIWWNDISKSTPHAFVLEYTLSDWAANGNNLSDIVLDELPEGANPNDYEIVTEYRYRDKETASSTQNAMEGYTKYDSQITYGEWSSTKQSTTRPTESDTLKIVNTWTQYHYYHYLNYYDGCNCIDSISYGTNKGYHTIDLSSPLSTVSMADQGGRQAYGSHTCSSCGFNFWFLSGTTLFYQYQTRTKTTTNYFYKWSDWSDWSTDVVTPSEDREVETRNVYRLKSSTVPVPKSIEIVKLPFRTLYNIGDEFDACGIVLKVTFTDDSFEYVSSGYKLSTPNMTDIGEKSVTVTYSGVSTSYEIKVLDVTIGDLNGNGRINSADYALIESYVKCQSILPSDEAFLSADLNKDGAVDAFDVILLDLYLNDVIDL